MTDDIIGRRRSDTDAKLEIVRNEFLRQLGDEREAIIGARTAVYVTGSCGRGDVGAASDLDPYVVDLDNRRSDERAAAIGAALTTSAAAAGLEGLDADGSYAELVDAESLFQSLGDPKDDETGALTRRMLLLLESRPLENSDAYEQLLALTLDEYWKNEKEHPDDYLPIVLVNDIVRYWRILLLNHESRIRKKIKKDQLSKGDEIALRRYSSYKLRVPRCLSCFSALAYLLSLTPTESAHIKREDVLRMVRMTPIERLEHLRAVAPGEAGRLDTLRELYAAFLEKTDGGKTALTDRLKEDESDVKAVSDGGKEFTKQMFELIQSLGGGRTLHRAIVV